MEKHSVDSTLSIEYIKSRVEYDPITGVITWKAKPDAKHSRWNLRYAGKQAGSVMCVTPKHIGPKSYRRITIDGVPFYEHRLAWFITHGEWPDEVDHINGEGTDNRLSNLRAADRLRNRWNSRGHHNSTTGFKGVCHYPRLKRPYRAEVRSNGMTVLSQFYHTAEEAGRAVDQCARELHGEFAYQNFPDQPLN